MVESLIIITFFLSGLLTLVCINSPQQRNPKIFLSLFFGSITIQTGIKYLGFSTKFLVSYPALLFIPELTNIIIPEVIYLYVLAVLNKSYSRSLYAKLAILPILSLIIFFTFYFITNQFTLNKYYVFECFVGLTVLSCICNILFMTISLNTIRNAAILQNVTLSSHNQIILFWIKWLLWLLLIKALFSVAYFALQIFHNQQPWFAQVYEIQRYTAVIISLVATSLTAYYGLRNPALFDTITENPTVEQSIAIAILAPEAKKVIKKSINEEEIPSFLNKIESLVVSEKLFLDPEVSPVVLSERTGIPVYKVTYTLNKGAGKNFNEYINSFRVEFAKQILSDPENNKQTIFSVALNSGFASEAPFYAAFKKYVGQSPSAYRTSVEKNS